MSLKRNLLTWGSALLLGWGVLTFNPGKLESNQALAQTPTSCNQIIEKHETKLEGSWGGIFDGCLDKLKPKNSTKNEYLDSITCVDNFLTEFNQKSCDPNNSKDLYNKSLEVLLENINVKDQFARNKVRSVLKRVEILDHQKQLEKIANKADDTKNQIKRAEKVFDNLNPIAQKLSIERIENLKNYLKYLRIESVVVTDLALYLREKPKITPVERIDSERVKGIVRAYSALNQLIVLQLQISNDDFSMAIGSFKEWKKDQSKVYQRLLNVLEISLDHGDFKTREGKSWVQIGYLNSQGKWITGNEGEGPWATKEFSKMWGDNGENFYGKIETLDNTIKEMDKIKLIPTKKFTKPVKETPKKEIWVNLSTCPEVDLSKPENAFPEYHKRLKEYFKGNCSRKDLKDVEFPSNSFPLFEIFTSTRFEDFKNYKGTLEPCYTTKTGIPGVDKYYQIPYRRKLKANIDLILKNGKTLNCDYLVYSEKINDKWKLRLRKNFKYSCGYN